MIVFKAVIVRSSNSSIAVHHDTMIRMCGLYDSTAINN